MPWYCEETNAFTVLTRSLRPTAVNQLGSFGQFFLSPFNEVVANQLLSVTATSVLIDMITAKSSRGTLKLS